MKNWLYIPFLVLMAVTYTRLVDNYNSPEGMIIKRAPASVPEESNEDCVDITARFNPHLKTKNCSL